MQNARFQGPCCVCAIFCLLPAINAAIFLGSLLIEFLVVPGASLSLAVADPFVFPLARVLQN